MGFLTSLRSPSIGRGVITRAAVAFSIAIFSVLALTYLAANAENQALSNEKLDEAVTYYSNRIRFIDEQWAIEAERIRTSIEIGQQLLGSDQDTVRLRFIQFASSQLPLSVFTHAVLADEDGLVIASYKTRSQQDLSRPVNADRLVWVRGESDNLLYKAFGETVRLRASTGRIWLYAPLDSALLGGRHLFANTSLEIKWQSRSFARFDSPTLNRALIERRENWVSRSLQWEPEGNSPELTVLLQKAAVLPIRELLLVVTGIFFLSLALGWLILGRWLARKVSSPIESISRAVSHLSLIHM